jgi:hypothetical protein
LQAQLPQLGATVPLTSRIVSLEPATVTWVTTGLAPTADDVAGSTAFSWADPRTVQVVKRKTVPRPRKRRIMGSLSFARRFAGFARLYAGF